MKIAILTLPLHTNYGGILQAYALQTVLQRMGHEVEVLQKIPTNTHPPLLMPAVYTKRLIHKILVDPNTRVFLEKTKRREKPIIESNTSRFIADNIRLRHIKTLRDIAPSDYDAIIVGSDQIWRKPYFMGMWNAPMKDAFLHFTHGWDIKRIAYAASFGCDNTDEYSRAEIEQCRKSLTQFNAISVREDSGVQICRDTLGQKALHLLDPTMLLDKDDYIQLIKKSPTPPSPGNLLCYILDPTPFKDKIISEITSRKHLTPFSVTAPVDDLSLPPRQRIQPPVEAWLRGFMDAEYIVTDSFHACAFSIIFGKPFIAIGNTGRGLSRFTSLLTTFGLQDRLILPQANLNKTPDIINLPLPTSLSIPREAPLSFIKTSLS